VPLHLRPGAREWFFEWLQREQPRLVPRYQELYRRGAYLGADYRSWLAARVQPLLQMHGLSGRRSARGSAPAGFPAGSLPDTSQASAAPASPQSASPQSASPQSASGSEPAQLSLC
jgi:hypothetical protein